MSSGYGNYQGYNDGGSNSNYYEDFEPYQAQDAYGTYAYQGGGGGSYSGSYINQATGMNPYFSNAMQMQWQTMRHFYSTDAYGGGGDSNGSYRSGSRWNSGQRGTYLGNDQHAYPQDQDSARPHKRHKNKDSRPSPSQRESYRPYVSAPFVNMTSFQSHRHLNSSPRSSSPPSSSPAPPPPTSPSPSYLEVSEAPFETTSSANTSRKLLILDLNGTLVLRSPRPQGKTTYNSQQRPAPRAVYPRPYMGVFREWMFHEANRKWLDVMVWSSAQPHSVIDMVQQAFGEKGKKMLKAIWARDKMGLGADVYHQKVQTIKDLAKPWDELASLPSSRSSSPDPNARHPETPSASSPVTHSALTTLLLDDSFKKAILQPYNHVIIKEYTRAMRNADLASLAAETRRNQIVATATAKKEEEEDTYSIASTPASSPPHVVDAPDAIVKEREGESESEQKSKKRRKEKKSKKIQEEVDAADGDIAFDETLLAIIGILNEAKFQSNIAAWARNGGLWGPYASSVLERQEREKSLAEVGVEGGVPHDAGKNEQDNGETADADVPVGEESEVKEQAGPPIWYEHPGTMLYWSSKGRESLEELGIEIKHGLVER